MSDWSQFRQSIFDAGDEVLMLLDRDAEPVADLSGAIEWRGPRERNKTTVATLSLRPEHPAVALLLALDLPEDSAATAFTMLHDAYYILIDDGWERDVYRVSRIIDPLGGGELVTVEAKHIFRYAEKIALWASPGSPLVAQLKYRDMRAGESLKVLKEYLLVALLNEFQPGGIDGWDLWDPQAWSGVNPDLWAAMVNPVNPDVVTAYTVLDARFDMATDLFTETLDAAGLMLTVDMWLVGDPQPFPDHAILTRPTIVIDVVPRQVDTAVTGTAADMLTGLVRTFSVEANAPRMGLASTPSTAAGRLPWVVWRPQDMAGVSGHIAVVKSEDSHVIVGGKSPEALNRMIAGGAKAVFGGVGAALAGAIPVFGGLINAAAIFLGEVVGESMKDKLFAFQSFVDAARRALHGRFTNRTQVGTGDGWTLSAMQQGFQMLEAGSGRVQISFDVSDQSVYEQGRDYSCGDQGGVEHRGRVWSTYVSATVRGRAADGSRIREVTLGDPRALEDPAAALARSAKSISNAVGRLKTFVS